MLYSIRRMQSIAIGAAAIAFAAASGPAFAASTAPTVTYEAKGKFATTVPKGTDIFRLAGEPFDIILTASEATKPHSNGKGYATYTGLSAKGTVTSGLIPQSPVTLSSTHTFLALAIGNPKYDIIEMVIPVTVVKEKVTITAKITLPHGSFTKWTIAPFSSTIKLTATDAVVSYASGTNSATLSIDSGSLEATAGTASAALQSPAAQVLLALQPTAALAPDADAITESFRRNGALFRIG